MTRGELRLAIMQEIDAANTDGTFSQRWNTEAGRGEVDRVASAVADREWRRLLSANPDLRITVRSARSNESGRWLVADLSVTNERLFRVRGLVIEGRIYQYNQLAENMLAAEGTDTVARYNWFRMGDEIAVLPTQASTTGKFIVSHIPKKISNLGDDDTEIEFPDGYELVLVYETAAQLLTKGGAELNTTGGLRALATEWRDEMLQDVSRFTTHPHSFGGPSDSPQDWGG